VSLTLGTYQRVQGEDNRGKCISVSKKRPPGKGLDFRRRKKDVIAPSASREGRLDELHTEREEKGGTRALINENIRQKGGNLEIQNYPHCVARGMCEGSEKTRGLMMIRNMLCKKTKYSQTSGGAARTFKGPTERRSKPV